MKASPTAPNLCCSEAPAFLLSYRVNVFLPSLVLDGRYEGAEEEEPGGEPGKTTGWRLAGPELPQFGSFPSRGTVTGLRSCHSSELQFISLAADRPWHIPFSGQGLSLRSFPEAQHQFFSFGGLPHCCGVSTLLWNCR